MTTSSADPSQPVRAIGYGRVSTEEQSDSGLGLDSQRAAIAMEANRRGWELVEYIEDRGYSGKDLDRPGIQCALDHLRERRADVLLVAKLDRLSRSMVDFTDLLERRSQREGWRIVALDLGIDTTTPVGEMIANTMASQNRYERRIIGQRTREALAVRKAQGVRLGRPERVPEDVVARMQAQLVAGISIRAVARGLTEDGVPTPQGGLKWYASSVSAVLATHVRESSEAT
jgi:DNA invertase Pin-like site-specific DNA recombinase